MAERPASRPFADILDARLSRRQMLSGAAAAALAGVLPLAGCAVDGRRPGETTFTRIPPSSEDALKVAPEYDAKVLYRWGDPVGVPGRMPAFRMDASNSAADQAVQAGMHHDGMWFHPLPAGARDSAHGLLTMNHEYLDDGLLHSDGQRTWSAEKVRKAQAAVGVSIIEVRMTGGAWEVVRPSSYARRITAFTPCAVGGPAAGSAMMRTAADPAGREILGTYNGCANGWTPWGTYLTCEENWNFQFVKATGVDAHDRRYGIGRGRAYRWNEYDERFDAARHANEPNRFGWIVEIDPYDPNSKPVKRTAMGRFKHEGACPNIGPDRRIAFYMGDDEAFEYLYKFVTARPYRPNDRAANRAILDEGTLYAARFDADGSGVWLPLVHGVGPLTAANGFRDQAEVLVKTRQAADAVGATPMDRPEWTAVHPVTREGYATLSTNGARGAEKRPGADAANPRTFNVFGHIIRWREANDDVGATTFKWDIFAMGGVPDHRDLPQRGKFTGDAFGCPDGLWFDARGVLWVQTDVSPTALNKGDFAPLGNNQMLAADPASGEFRRFLVGPRGCEITGFTTTPDGRTAFVNIQHPGENPGELNNPDDPRANSNWPDFDPNGRPRSATVVIRRKDGGIVGT